jgi:hypothetical protein
MIRASGGKVAVKVKRLDTSGEGARAYIARHLGPWTWTVPSPKGHPRTPKWETLHGRAHSMEDAVEEGLARLTEVYGLNP